MIKHTSPRHQQDAEASPPRTAQLRRLRGIGDAARRDDAKFHTFSLCNSSLRKEVESCVTSRHPKPLLERQPNARAIPVGALRTSGDASVTYGPAQASALGETLRNSGRLKGTPATSPLAGTTGAITL